MKHLQRLAVIREFINNLKLLKSTNLLPNKYLTELKENKIIITLSVIIEKEDLDDKTYCYLIT